MHVDDQRALSLERTDSVLDRTAAGEFDQEIHQESYPFDG